MEGHEADLEEARESVVKILEKDIPGRMNSQCKASKTRVPSMSDGYQECGWMQ